MGIMARQFKPGQLRPGLLYDITASYAVTASYVDLNILSTDRIVKNNITASVSDTSTIFLITSASADLFAIQSTGVAVFATQSTELANPAPNGGLYFTSSSFYVGLD